MLLRLMFALTALVLAHGLPADGATQTPPSSDTDTSTQLIQLKALVEDLKIITQGKTPQGTDQTTAGNRGGTTNTCYEL